MASKRSIKCTYDGINFDSTSERDRYIYLSFLEKSGEIFDLKCQVKYELIPAQYEEFETGEFYKKGEKKGMPKIQRKLVEHAITYIADFVYYDKNGLLCCEDVKGFTHYANGMYNNTYNVFSIKRKLMLYVHGIKVKEITSDFNPLKPKKARKKK